MGLPAALAGHLFDAGFCFCIPDRAEFTRHRLMARPRAHGVRANGQKSDGQGSQDRFESHGVLRVT